MNNERAIRTTIGRFRRRWRKEDQPVRMDTLLMQPVARSWVARAVLAAGIGAYLWVYLKWTLANYDQFVAIGCGGYDFSIHYQGLWLLSRAHSPFLTISGTQYYADHLSLIMLFFVPLFWLFST